MARWAEDMPEGLAGLQVSHCTLWVPCSGTRVAGLSHSPNNMAPCTTSERFLRGPALAQAVRPALSTASGAKNPKNIFRLMWHRLPSREPSVHTNIHFNLWRGGGVVYTLVGPAQLCPGVMLDQAV